MGRFSDKIKIVYLTLVILFGLGVFVYLLDTWGLVKLESYLPFLKDKPPLVSESDDNPTLIELERLKKQREELEERDTKSKEMQAKLDARAAELEKLKAQLDEVKKGLEEEKKKQTEAKAAEVRRDKLIEEMAARLGAMPPQDAISIVNGWSNADLVDVLRRMERASEDEGTPSIVPFLITKLPQDRAQIITSLMLDPDARNLPKPDE